VLGQGEWSRHSRGRRRDRAHFVHFDRSLRRQHQPGLWVVGNHEARPDDLERMNCRGSARRPWREQARSRDHRVGHGPGYRQQATGHRGGVPRRGVGRPREALWW
jgi:hypothetical protein